MFTVKHINQGIETILQSARVVYVPMDSLLQTSERAQVAWDEVYCYEKDNTNPDYQPIVLRGGYVYVMNENGKTVANYTMCTAPQMETKS